MVSFPYERNALQHGVRYERSNSAHAGAHHVVGAERQKKNARPATCWVSGIGNLYLLPGITLPQRVDHGQYCLPGISK